MIFLIYCMLLFLTQVISGMDPVNIRSKLRNALPHAPEKQLVITLPNINLTLQFVHDLNNMYVNIRLTNFVFYAVVCSCHTSYITCKDSWSP